MDYDEKPTQETIICTPTWRGITQILLTLIEAGTPPARKAAIKEIYRMADLADAYVEYCETEARKS